MKGTAHIASYVSATAHPVTNNTDNILAALIKCGRVVLLASSVCYGSTVISSNTQQWHLYEWPPNGIQTLRIARLRRYGPGNIGVDATCLFGYKGGVISNCTGKSVDHATLVVGAGYDSSLAANPPNPAGPMPYWIVVSPHAAPWTLQALCRQVPARYRSPVYLSACLLVCLSMCLSASLVC